MRLDRISLEPSRLCSKACAFCYNGSGPDEIGGWTADDVIAFVTDCARRGDVRAVSFGGGEPLEWPALFDALGALDGVLFRSLTTNGLPLLAPGMLERLAAARPDKVHVSLHAPEHPREVARVARQVTELSGAGLKSGVNLLVRRSRLAEAADAVRALASAGIGNDRVVFLPLRAPGGVDTPSPQEIARVAGGPFQSMTCLTGCAMSPRFASIAADRTVAWCSYTTARRRLPELTWAGLTQALHGLGLSNCADGWVALGKRREVDPAR